MTDRASSMRFDARTKNGLCFHHRIQFFALEGLGVLLGPENGLFGMIRYTIFVHVSDRNCHVPLSWLFNLSTSTVKCLQVERRRLRRHGPR